MSDNLPALRSEVVPDFATGQLALLDDVERVMRLPVSELRALSIDVVHAGSGIFKNLKRAIGVLAMAMRAKTSDRDYGDWAHDYAALWGIDPVTLKRWREDAEKARGAQSPMTRKSTSETRKDILSENPNLSTDPPTVDSGEGEPVSSTAASGREDEGAAHPPSSPAGQSSPTSASSEVPGKGPVSADAALVASPGHDRSSGTGNSATRVPRLQPTDVPGSPRTAAGSEGRAGPASARVGSAPSHAKDAAMRQGTPRPDPDRALADVIASNLPNADEFLLLKAQQVINTEVDRRGALKRTTPAPNGSAAGHASFFKKPVKK